MTTSIKKLSYKFKPLQYRNTITHRKHRIQQKPTESIENTAKHHKNYNRKITTQNRCTSEEEAVGGDWGACGIHTPALGWRIEDRLKAIGSWRAAEKGGQARLAARSIGESRSAFFKTRSIFQVATKSKCSPYMLLGSNILLASKPIFRPIQNSDFGPVPDSNSRKTMRVQLGVTMTHGSSRVDKRVTHYQNSHSIINSKLTHDTVLLF